MAYNIFKTKFNTYQPIIRSLTIEDFDISTQISWELSIRMNSSNSFNSLKGSPFISTWFPLDSDKSTLLAQRECCKTSISSQPLLVVKTHLRNQILFCYRNVWNNYIEYSIFCKFPNEKWGIQPIQWDLQWAQDNHRNLTTTITWTPKLILRGRSKLYSLCVCVYTVAVAIFVWINL